MKKFFLILVSSISLTTAFAQDRAGGIRGGINLAQWKLTATSQGQSFNTTFYSKSGFIAGLYQTVMITRTTGLQPEIFYNSNGTSLNGTTYSTEYISIPIFFRYNMTDRVHLLGGPQFSLLMSASGGSTNIKSFFNSTDFGFLFGLGADLDKFNVGVRYNLGLTNIVNSSYNSNVFGSSGTDAKLTNVGWQFVCGVKLFAE